MRAEFLIGQGLSEIATNFGAQRHRAGRGRGLETILKAHGRFGLDRALAFAIDAAEQGVPVAPRVQLDVVARRGQAASE